MSAAVDRDSLVHDLPSAWAPAPPPLPGRAIVVAPHPDDEVLGCAGALRWLRAHDVPITVLAVTDGEGSHRRSACITPAELAATRADERAEALRRLGIEADIVRLGIPDGAVAEHAHHVERLVSQHVRAAHRGPSPGVAVITPWSGDRHPDHEAVGAACAWVAAATRCSLWQVTIWAKVRPGADLRPADGKPAAFMLGDDDRRAKADAVAAFQSQIAPVGPAADGTDGPVLRPFELDRMLDGREVMAWR